MYNKNIYSNIELVIESKSDYSKGNSVNYKKLSNWNGSVDGNVSTLGLNGDSSFYGLYDMGGQLYQWTDSAFQDDNKRKVLRGGCFASTSSECVSKNHFKHLYVDETISDGFLGFRVASYTNPNNYVGYQDINDVGNYPDICDKRKLGRVDYTYKIMINLVSNSSYCEFLNSVDPNGIYDQYVYDPQMGLSSVGGIVLDKCSSPKYAVKENMNNKPVAFITWVMASKYCNWLHNNKASFWNSTMAGAYDTDNTRLSGAKYFIPSENEWYKAAYYDSTLNSNDGGYWTYSTKSDDTPLAVLCNSTGDAVSVEKQFTDTKIFPLIIRGNDEIIEYPTAVCPTVSITGYDEPYFSGYLGDNIAYIVASVSGLNPDQKYNYEFSSVSSNWPCKISPISGEFTADENNYSINAILQFKPQDVYNFTNFIPNLSSTTDPAINNRNFSDELYNNLSLSITTEDCPVVSDNTKIIKRFMLSSGSIGLPIVSQKDCAGISFATPSGSNQIEISGSLCGQYVPLVMVVTNPKIGKSYNYTLSSSESAVSLSPRSGTVSFGGGSGSLNRITSLLDLNGENSTVIGVSLSRVDANYTVSDYVSVKCLKPCEKSANNHANFDNKAIWGFCASDCAGNQPQRRSIPSVTTVGTNGGTSSYGTYDQDGNVLELCELFGISEIYRGGAFNSTILGKYARFTFDTDTFPNQYSDYIGFRIASYTNPHNYNEFKLVSDVGSPPTGNIADKDTGYGSVNYAFNIAEYPVTNQQYCEFLNSTSTTGINGVLGNASSGWIYNPLMSGCFGGIDRTGGGTILNPFVYTTQQVMENKPIRHVNKSMAFRYCNWLHNNKQSGWGSSESGSYNFYTLTNNLSGTRSSCSKYFIPNENEWYKAAYYDGDNTNNTSAEYWTYATQTNTLPGSVFASSVGNGLIPSD
jgi:formylglycine-generating enzyme required for sulfatase activity